MKNRQYVRYIIYVILFVLLFIGHRFITLIPLDVYPRLRIALSTVIIASAVYIGKLCFHSEGVRSRWIFAAIVVIIAIFGSMTWYNFVFKGAGAFDGLQFKATSNFLVNYANMVAFMFMLYPIEVLRPRWLNIKRVALLFLPIVVIGIVGRIPDSKFITDWQQMRIVNDGISAAGRMLMIFYVFFPLVMIYACKRRYTKWCYKHFSSTYGSTSSG